MLDQPALMRKHGRNSIHTAEAQCQAATYLAMKQTDTKQFKGSSHERLNRELNARQATGRWRGG